MQLRILLCFIVATVAARRTYHGDQVLRITPVREDQITTIEHLSTIYDLDFWSDVRGMNRPVDIHVSAKDITAFKVALTRFRVDYSIFIEDLQTAVEAERGPHRPTSRDVASFDYEVYHTYEEIQQWIDDFATAYSDVATADVVGTSFEGRQFKALTISSGPGKPKFVINCGIHAREWVTPATCMYSAQWLVESPPSVLQEVDFVFIPSSNPDGYAYTWSNDRMWRKTRSTHGGLCVGVDPNRNWDANHCGPGSSTSPCSDTYCGPAPFSEPCTLAQKNFVEGLSDVKMYVDVHSYSQLWMFPYGYTTSRPANFLTMNSIAQDSVAAIQATHGMVYEAGQISTTIYVASGSTADYFYDGSNIQCTFATELRDTGRYGFVLPERLILPTAEESYQAFLVMAQAVASGQCN
ncbi:carboxypeptidase B-like [Ciona intestinalis]